MSAGAGIPEAHFQKDQGHNYFHKKIKMFDFFNTLLLALMMQMQHQLKPGALEQINSALLLHDPCAPTTPQVKIKPVYW